MEETKGIVFTAAMAEYLMRFSPHLRGMYILALYRRHFTGEYAESIPSWCREFLELSDREQEGAEIRLKKKRMLTDGEYRPILSYLNQKTGRDFRLTDSFRRHVDARIRDGAHVEDFMLVIDNTVSAWAGDAKMRRYLRPETLFGTKFDDYRTMQQAGLAGSSFDTDEFFEAAVRASYKGVFDEDDGIFGKDGNAG